MVWLVLAVVVDSAVTLFVGWRLGKVAEKHTKAAAESIKPVFQEELANALHNVLPLVLPFIQGKLNVSSDDNKCRDDNNSRLVGSNDADSTSNP